jgi:CheY-like chemotaxis protein
VRQILVNLLSNALKFTQRGGVQVSLGYQERDSQHRIHIRVQDTGIGMSPAQTACLFKAFSQADTSTSRKFGGTGLGLTICQRLANLLGGNVQLVATELNVGTEFLLDIPVTPVASMVMVERLATPAKPKSLENAAIRLSGRILLAEDGPDNQRLIKLILNKAGAEVDLAENGRIAWEKLTESYARKQPYDLLLSDMQMPELDGYALATRVKAHGYRLPIVALTAHPMASDAQKCFSAGCDDYATKPIDRVHLLSVLHKWLQRSQVETSAQLQVVAVNE